MGTTVGMDFRWLSTLGLSVILFIFSGLFRIFIGVLTPILLDSKIGRPAILMSHRTDRELFKEEPSIVLQQNESVAKTRRLALTMLAGILVTAGILVVGIAWFALKGGNWWALITLGVAGVAEVPFWFVLFRHYVDAGIRLTLSDVPPFIWVPEILLIPAVLLGIIGMRQL